MSNNSSSSSGGIGFFGLLAILFIALKLLGYISWSWFWVLAPIWGPFLFVIALVGIVFIGAVVAVAVEERAERRRRRHGPH